jgi:hypothetical protein
MMPMASAQVSTEVPHARFTTEFDGLDFVWSIFPLSLVFFVVYLLWQSRR